MANILNLYAYKIIQGITNTVNCLSDNNLKLKVKWDSTSKVILWGGPIKDDF